MLALSQGKIRFTFPITPAEIQITSGSEVETFTVISGQERTGKPTSKVKRVSFTAILPRGWAEIWETSEKQTVTYKTPEITWKLLEEWKGKPVILNFEELFSQTMLLEGMDLTYKDGQGNLHVNFSLVEYKPVKIVSYSNSKQLLKPGVIVTRAAKSRPNTTGKTDKKNKKKKGKKAKTAGEKTKANKMTKGEFDYLAQKERILDKNTSVKGGK
ncbi:hypothetical protein J25TS5_14590 [Paenibacillus faecis]|uniref:hypothetical protein n=1 Tax=Paenibacillus faecis TaxID=862114 RepID=UPI001B0B47C1|nr:hypothetical protein [Paenibacillus faecis]GIO84527.1 hypothetical protein J25TS5_14590 [Paenibacillus faecis]